jgi:hypothetical protein
MVDDEFHAHVNEVLKGAGGFLSGRVTYELMAGFWPTADADPGNTPFVKEFAPIWRGMPKVVYSRTLTSAGWNTAIAREVVREEVEGLKARPWGSRGRGRGPRRGLHAPGPDRRVPHLRPPDPDRGGEASLSRFEGEGSPAPRRDPDLRERGRPSPVRASPTRWGELAQAGLADAVNADTFFRANSCMLSGPFPVSVRTASDIRSKRPARCRSAIVARWLTR